MLASSSFGKKKGVRRKSRNLLEDGRLRSYLRDVICHILPDLENVVAERLWGASY
jgi:hypothetical protein